MTLKINQIYKVKEGHEGKCDKYRRYRGRFIKIERMYYWEGKINSIQYNILDKAKQEIEDSFCSCFTEDDLELEEEKADCIYKNEDCKICPKQKEEEVKEKSLEDLEVEPIVKLIYLYESDSIKNQTMRKEINLLYTLLEEKLGIKVKIK